MTDDERRKIFSKRLGDLLYEKHLTARDLANRIGISEGSMTQYKKGVYLPKGYVLQDLADALNVNVSYLLGEDNQPKNRGYFVEGSTSEAPDHQNDHVDTNPVLDYELNIIEKLPMLTDEAKQLISQTVDALIDGNQHNVRFMKAYFDALNRINRKQ